MLNNGQEGTASVSRTHFDSRAPEPTRVEFTGLGVANLKGRRRSPPIAPHAAA
jgi:hypothetical protein